MKEQTTTTTSDRFNINWRDFFRGMILFVGTPVFYTLQELIPGWDANPLLKIAIGALITYIIKNFFQPTAIVVKNPSEASVEAVREGKAEAKIVPVK